MSSFSALVGCEDEEDMYEDGFGPGAGAAQPGCGVYDIFSDDESMAATVVEADVDNDQTSKPSSCSRGKVGMSQSQQ